MESLTNQSLVWNSSYDTIRVKSHAHLGPLQSGLMDANTENTGSSARKEIPGETQVRTQSIKKGLWPIAVHPLELLMVIVFLGLVFLLGIFPLKDTDFWWHLRTGDWILANGKWPRSDLYTYTVNPDTRWIDLHWGFQVLLSFGYELGGVPLLNLAKCGITTLSVSILLLGCRRPGWPLWVSIVSWLPALLVLSGRMYVRPETISLLWMSIVLAVLFHWRKHPRLMWLLPPVFMFWINTQGLFVLGFVLFGFALAEAAIDPGTWGRDYRKWWSRAIATLFFCLIACLMNPYGFRGLMFPVELAGTMGNPVFRTIGELTPIPQFIQSLGFRDFPSSLSLTTLPLALKIIFINFRALPLPLQLHFTTMLLGFASFLVTLFGGFLLYIHKKKAYRGTNQTPAATKKTSRRRSSSRRQNDSVSQTDEPTLALSMRRPSLSSNVRFSLFRLLAFIFFSILSFQATRNSHQFAAVLGTVTAANLAQWASLVGANRVTARKADGSKRLSVGTVLAFVLVCFTFIWVGSGKFYVHAGEGRTIGLGEEPLWFPHAAVKAAGQEGLPPRFASFHNGHAALYDYYWGPERKVFSDARLEVIGANLYQDQMRLSSALNLADSSWRGLVAKAQRPVMLSDHLANSGVSVTLLSSNDYNCIHFDPIAATFAPKESLEKAGIKPFDFFEAHYSDSGFRALNQPERKALARALRNISGGLGSLQRDDLARPLMLAGLGLSKKLVEEDPASFDAWKLTGQLLQVGFTGPVNRERSPESFVIDTDLALVRSIYALKQAQKLEPYDFSNTYSLMLLQRGLAQFDQEFETLSRIIKLTPVNQTQAAEIGNAVGRMSNLRQLMGLSVMEEVDKKGQPALPQNIAESLAQPLSAPGASRAEIERNINALLRDGQIRRAVETLNASIPAEGAPTVLLEKLGGLWLWLGRPEEARKAFERIRDEPVRQTLLAVCWMVQNETEQALSLLNQAEQVVNQTDAGSDLTFTVKSLLTLIQMESGNLGQSQKSFDALSAIAKSSQQLDTVNLLRRFLPATQQ